MTRVLFVCLGNICRSPQAEGIFVELVHSAGLQTSIEADSAGTSSYHQGDLADSRTRAASELHGIVLTHRSRPVSADDLDTFDYVLAMDQNNLDGLHILAGRDMARLGKLYLLRSFDPTAENLEVPDPYSGGPGGFERVFQMCKRACVGLLAEIRAK